MDTITITPKAKRSGMIMPLVATIVVFIFLLGIAMLKIGFSSRFTAARTTTEIVARSAADAGLAMAMHLLKETRSVSSASDVPLENTRAAFSYTVTPDPVRGFRIRSVGTSGNMSKTVYAMTWATSFWSYAILVDDTINLKSNMLLDVWPENSTFTPTIGTTSTETGAITLSPNTNIPGDIVVGAGSNPDTVVNSKKTTIINGDVYASDNDLEFPFWPVPGGLPPIPWPEEPNGLTITTNRTYLTPITFGNGDRITIRGDVIMYVAGNMILDNSAELYIEAGSSLELYLGGSLIALNGSIITNGDQDARDLKIYGTPTCRIIDLKNSGDLWAAIYAPNADLLIYNSGSTYGSFIGNSFEMKQDAEFYYDTRLLEDPTEHPSFFQVERWWERGDDLI